MKRKTIKLLSLLFASLALILMGCANTNDTMEDTQSDETENASESLVSTGTLYLMLNPEIAIEYDEEALVTAVRGENADGEELIETYTDYVGKHSRVVIQELILKFGEAGYFENEVEGETKRLVIELEAGSNLPGDNFLEEMAASAQRALEDYQIYREEEVETTEETTESTDSQTTSSAETQNPPATVSYADNTLMSLAEAKQIAFEHAQVDVTQVIMDDYELNFDDGVPIYELDFDVGPNEYEYEIHAVTGEVLYFDQDLETTESNAQVSDSISLDEAKQIAFNHAGVDGTQASFDEEEWDEDDGVPYFSLEFEIGEDEYEYEIHAVTGEILDYDIDLD